MAITIQITDGASPVIERAQRVLRSGAVERVMGQTAAEAVREHLSGLDSTRPNMLGGRRTHFWGAAAKSTSWEAQPGEATVSINQVGIRQRLLGGRIVPTKGKYLTIPASPDAYGRRAGQFDNLRFGFAVNPQGNLQPALVEAGAPAASFGGRPKDGSRAVKRGAGVGGKVMFWLVTQVYQQADPSVLPSTKQLEDVAVSAANRFIARQLAKGGRNG